MHTNSLEFSGYHVVGNYFYNNFKYRLCTENVYNEYACHEPLLLCPSNLNTNDFEKIIVIYILNSKIFLKVKTSRFCLALCTFTTDIFNNIKQFKKRIVFGNFFNY